MTSDEPEVTSDPELAPEERELIIKLAADQKRLKIHSEIPSVTRWCLDHPDYIEQDRRSADDAIYATRGTLPMGVLKLSGGKRSKEIPSAMLGVIPDDE